MNYDKFKEKYFNLHYIFGAVSFLIPLIVYFDTVAPTLSFWDCGEFIACSYTMGIPHPPGAPIYLLIGKFFSVLPIPGDIAFKVNLVSALSSIFTVLLLYLTIVRLVKKWWQEESFIVYFSACLGALSFTFSDTFWFNAVEAEVYAVSMFLTALVLYLAILWMDNHEDYHASRFLIFIVYLFCLAVGVHLLSVLVIPSILLLILFTNRKVLFNLNLWAIVPVLILLGISAYLILYIRSGMNPFFDENNPETLGNLWKYLNREQYGEQSLFLSIFDRVAPFWEYQIKKMYLRYFAWNFIGEGTIPGIDRGAAEVLSFRGLYGLPFLLGLFGVVHHFKRDWKRALAILTMFIITGVAITIYLNQPDPQPRERDYVYIGSFYAYAIWIGIGMQAIFEMVRSVFSNMKDLLKPALITTGALVFIFVPFNMARINYESQDRSGNYVAWDHSYNILQNCEENAILITNGDNDTFPIWYLQTVEGIRTDIKIVNLSLLNTNWYIQQLKHQLGVPMTLRDDEIENIMPVLWEKKRTVVFEFPKYLSRIYNGEKPENVNYNDNEKVKMAIEISPTLAGRLLRVQDRMILDIIYANRWKYPVYFAVTVPESGKLNLNKYLRFDGLVFKLFPEDNPKPKQEILNDVIYNKLQVRNLNNPDVYYNKMTKGLIQNYRNTYVQMVSLLFNSGKKDIALKTLEKMEEDIPEYVIPVGNNYALEQIALLYYQLQKPDEFKNRLDKLTKNRNISDNDLLKYINWYTYELKDYIRSKELCEKLYYKDPGNGRYVGTLVSIYEGLKEYDPAISILDKWLQLHPDQTDAVNKRNAIIQLKNKADSDSAKQN
ncbi:protein O-mannosyl-transferase family [candidate division KSB1 bacterium]